MRCFSLAASLLSLLHTRLAVAEQITTVTVVQNPDFTTTIAQLVATDPPSQPSTLQTSNLQASSSRAGYGGYASSAPNTVNGIDVEGGAAGTNNSFSLSTGGLIAIIVIVILVVIFGIASVTLFVIAKRRQWSMRTTLKRASRRLTGRKNPPPPRSDVDRRKRSGVIAGSKKAGTTAAYPPGHKRPLVVEVVDEEKGTHEGSRSKPKAESGWKQRLWGNDWK